MEVQAIYDLKVAALDAVERVSEQGEIDVVYMDAARVSASAVVPYGWQFVDEDVFMPSTPGVGITCRALLTRTNHPCQ